MELSKNATSLMVDQLAIEESRAIVLTESEKKERHQRRIADNVVSHDLAPESYLVSHPEKYGRICLTGSPAVSEGCLWH